MYYCVIITSLFCHYYIIMTNRKSCNDDSILTCYTKRQPPFLRYYCIITSLSQRGLLIGYYCSLLQSSELADGNVVLGLLPEVLLTLLRVGGVRAVCRTPPESLLPPLLVVPGLKCMNPGSPVRPLSYTEACTGAQASLLVAPAYWSSVGLCNKHAFQSIFLFRLTTFLSTGEFHFISRLSSLCFLNSDFHCACICVGIMLWSTAGR